MKKKWLNRSIPVLVAIIMVATMFAVVEHANAQGPGGLCGGEFQGECKVIGGRGKNVLGNTEVSIRKTWSWSQRNNGNLGIHYKAETRWQDRAGFQCESTTRFPIRSHSVNLAEGRLRVHHSGNEGVGVRWGY